MKIHLPELESKLQIPRGILNLENIRVEELHHPITGKKISQFTPSSVMIPLSIQPNPSILFILRSQHLKSHPGEIGFPGGIQEEGEPPLETALREWEEELGTSRNHLQILGKFGSLLTVTGFQMDAFVGILSEIPHFSLNEEVESWFTVGLKDFWNIGFYCIDFQKLGRNRVYYFHLPNQQLLWGATAELVYYFLKEIFGFSRNPIPVSPNLTTKPFLDPNLIQ